MKYTSAKPPLVCMLTTNPCYRNTYKMTIKGILWHDTGANNPLLRRYVQPTDNDPNRAALLAKLGVNKNGNDWGHTTREVGVNAFVGKLANGSVAAVQTMPWEFAPWGCASGKKGSCNNGWAQFEICQDDRTDPAYFEAAYKEAVELTAYLCKRYNIDPMGTVRYNGVTVPTILCHWDSYKLGLGNGHSDVYDWFDRYGKTMDDVRRDVATLLKNDEEDDDMTGEEIYNKLMEYLNAKPLPDWVKKDPDFKAAVELGVTDGSRPNALPTRFETAMMAVRAAKKI